MSNNEELRVRSDELQAWLDERRMAATPMDEKTALFSGDMALQGVGLALAVGSFVFPWYIFLNQDDFGARIIAFSGHQQQIPAPVTDPDIHNLSPLAFEQLTTAVDPMATASIAPALTDAQKQEAATQPFPGKGQARPYRLVDIANGRALLRDNAGFFLVARGSRLPDDRRVVNFEHDGKGWVMVTTDGERIKAGD
ncbi:hypothetical protein [Limoniibacter endophyticus]|uniref:Uncharacterized protein n=1 Tax=Limoniibacter endophyticus TaxID=1565040 RepID=A0A8J3DMS0_9HYPH|nr:hypothetical protein [Limoniibacter endophyticus]GHC64605.1 hypothetical protein GCM10010136_06670 [Limoniibacter endophyticus]